MQFMNMINQQVHLQMEPAVVDLAPYLKNLDVDDAVESFGQLADQLLSQETRGHLVCSYTTTTPIDEFNPNLYFNPIQQQQQQQQPWPITTNHPSSSSSSSSSQASSPAPSDQYYSSQPASYFCSSSSSSSSLSSSGPASVASSCDSRDEFHQSGSSPGRSGRRKHRDGSSSSSRDLRQKNASAAEKYRRRLKGRERVLMREMEREQARNAKLRKQIEAKLALYKEFVMLLASNTCNQDADLAKLGSQSLSAIIGQVLAGLAPTGNWHQQQPSDCEFSPDLGSGLALGSGSVAGEDHYHYYHNNQKQLGSYYYEQLATASEASGNSSVFDDEIELRNQLNRFQQILANATGACQTNLTSPTSSSWPHEYGYKYENP